MNFCYMKCVIKKTLNGKYSEVKEIRIYVRNEIGEVFQPYVIQFADTLPKTRSNEIKYRILKFLASYTEIGNVTTLADS